MEREVLLPECQRGGGRLIKSMTGFGRGEIYGQGKKFVVELKSVNHRYCEMHLRLPKYMLLMEERCKKVLKDYVHRGRLDGFISVEDEGEKNLQVKIDSALAESHYKALKELRNLLDLPGRPTLRDMIQVPGLLTLEEPEEDVEKWWPFLEAALKQAAAGLLKMRETEGERLSSDLKKRFEAVAQINAEIKKRAPQVVEEYRGKLESRVQEMLGEGMMDKERLAAEVTIFAERSNITEEVVRLDSHLYQALNCLQASEPVGRKLDFLLQEMNREINTVASKASDLTISQLVVEVKSQLEKIREQVQNIE